MEVTIQRSNRKTVVLKIKPTGQIIVCCPFKYSLKNINQLIEQKKEWILKTVAKLKQIDYSDFSSCKKVLYLGRVYDVEETLNGIYIGDEFIKKTKGAIIQKTIKNWLIKKANQIVIDRLNYVSSRISIPFNNAKIGFARKKWGSCDSRKNIMLNFRLVMLPEEFIDYVCIHELCHINNMNHSKEFWQNVCELCPNYKHIKTQMKKYAFTLEIL